MIVEEEVMGYRVRIHFVDAQEMIVVVVGKYCRCQCRRDSFARAQINHEYILETERSCIINIVVVAVVVVVGIMYRSADPRPSIVTFLHGMQQRVTLADLLPQFHILHGVEFDAAQLPPRFAVVVMEELIEILSGGVHSRLLFLLSAVDTERRVVVLDLSLMFEQS